MAIFVLKKGYMDLVYKRLCSIYQLQWLHSQIKLDLVETKFFESFGDFNFKGLV